MRKNSKVLSAVILSVMIVATGCGTKSDTTTSVSQKQETTEAAATEISPTTSPDAVGEITITHSKGIAVVKENPKKAVVFDMGALDIIQSLGIEAEFAVPVSSVPEYLSAYADAANAGSIKEPDLEAIFSFEPEVIFISGRQSDYYEELSEIAPTVYLDLNAEKYMDDLTNNVMNIAAIFGKTAEAETKLAEINKKVSEVQGIVSGKDENALILLVNDGNISAYGSGSRFGIVHDLLGVKQADENIEASTHGQSASYEYIAELNPDIIYVVDRTAIVGGSASVTETLNNELVNGTKAAVNNKIISLDPEAWYLAGGGLASFNIMLEDVARAFAE